MELEPLSRCSICLCYLDSEDLFCATCGTENPLGAAEHLRQPAVTTHISFDCNSCGASMTYDAAAKGLRCPYCGNEILQHQSASRFVRADTAIPFSTDIATAEAIFRKWLGASIWRPSNLAQAAKLGKVAQVFVPFWSFSAQTHTHWTADSSPAPRGSRGDWYPVAGENRSRYTEVLVGGSSVLSQAEMNSLLPFQLSESRAPEQVDMRTAVVEQYQIPRKSARPQAKSVIESRELATCRSLVPGRSRNVKVNVQIASLIGQPILLPVWILAYHYKSDVHRVLINGQTGKITGSAPLSFGKLILAVAILVLSLLAIAALAIVFQ